MTGSSPARRTRLTPGATFYELTQSGVELWPVVHALLVWGGKHRRADGRVFRHAQCGTRLSESGRCDACGVTPGPEDLITERRRGYQPTRDDPVTQVLRAPHRLLVPIER